jgi:predicted DNA-binding transcriptional regulator YafY
VVLEPSLTSGPVWADPKIDRIDMAQVRVWIRSGRKLVLDYRDEQDRASVRTVWPFLIGYRETVRLLIAWCETREDFRTFRTDRVVEATFLDDRYPARPTQLRTRWQAKMDEEHRRYQAENAGPAAAEGREPPYPLPPTR